MKQQLNINKTFPKKSLGQNFIQNKDFIFKLSSLIRSDNDTNIFEIGPGMGALTDQLIKKKFKNLYLIEKDFLLFQKLEDRFKKDNNIFIFNGDALKYNYEAINKNQKSIIVGNLLSLLLCFNSDAIINNRFLENLSSKIVDILKYKGKSII